jgi:hypothetical protein
VENVPRAHNLVTKYCDISQCEPCHELSVLKTTMFSSSMTIDSSWSSIAIVNCRASALVDSMMVPTIIIFKRPLGSVISGMCPIFICETTKLLSDFVHWSKHKKTHQESMGYARRNPPTLLASAAAMFLSSRVFGWLLQGRE